MNKAKKEKQRQHAKARAGLTDSQIAELDAREAAEEALENRSCKLHMALFPEEFDFWGDSTADANDRKRGVNPMSSDYIAKTNAHRTELGFAPFMDESSDLPSNTRSWVANMLREGKEAELDKIILGRQLADKAKAAAVLQRGAMTREELEEKIDSIFASAVYLKRDTLDASELSVIAYRLYGCWFKFKHEGYVGTDEEFMIQLRRLCPGLSTQEYTALKQEALNAWVESYGY
ncbi:MAG: hypothetical protein ACI8R9_000134 [Paraglaciecola sp.]|jgi:hypothetical protein